VRGNATKIDALLLREYHRQAHSVPDLPVPRPFAGGYTDIFFTGVAKNVQHCDVASLYPSVMLQFDCLPVADQLGLFRHLLSDLRQFRLEAKARMRAAPVGERAGLNALQSTFKILINSFYGYLGFAQAHFADFDAGEPRHRDRARPAQKNGGVAAKTRRAGDRDRHRWNLFRPARGPSHCEIAGRADGHPAEGDRGRVRRALQGDVQLQGEKLPRCSPTRAN